ncbi:MAG: hypothetical protein LBT86_04635 [Deltaproteobacteria bacterium]|jgi:hypothetical protein|nr:hypothetical protein [Deltaproteobacteria bacterium]
MSDNASSAELITANGMAHSKMASATDRHVGALRHEMDQKAESHIQFIQEKNIREVSDMEVSRTQILSRVV